MYLSFGEYLVLRRRITAQAVLHLLKKQNRSRPHLGELAVKKGWMSWAQVLGLVSLAEQRNSRFGEVAEDQGVLSGDQVKLLLDEQKATTPTLEDCILSLGLLEPEELAEDLAAYKSEHATAES